MTKKKQAVGEQPVPGTTNPICLACECKHECNGSGYTWRDDAPLACAAYDTPGGDANDGA